MFSSKPYDRESFDRANLSGGHAITYFDVHLGEDTVGLAQGFPVVCIFVHDRLPGSAIEKLAAHGTRLIALRCAGFNNVDLASADRLGLTVVRVPAYSPHGVAEHTVGLMLALNRKIHRAHNRVREGNFSLQGLIGFDLNRRTVGIVGTGKIGAVVARILHGFGCRLVACDTVKNPRCEDLGVRYVDKETLLGESDIITLHCPLTPETHHLIDDGALARVRPGVMLVNTSRGALVDTRAVIRALKDGRIGYLGLDVYEEEEKLFFEDLSEQVIQDDVFSRLLTFPNVIVTGHQAYFTREALHEIAETTLQNISAFEAGRRSGNELEPALAHRRQPGLGARGRTAERRR